MTMQSDYTKLNKFLAVDTASAHLTVLAANGQKRALRYIKDCALRHSVLLMDEVDAAMDEVSLSVKDCDFFSAVTGPGSFTGIRIGISAVKAFSLAAAKPLMPLTSFELVAYNVNSNDFLTVVDAAHGHLYCCAFKGGEMGAPEYLSVDEVISRGLPVYGFQPLDLPRYTMLDAGECLAPAIERKLTLSEPFGEMHALYARKSQAEEGRK